MTDIQTLISPDISVTLAPVPKRQRIWEIDFLRGACVVMMLLDHLCLLFSEKMFGGAWIDYGNISQSTRDFLVWCTQFRDGDLHNRIRIAVLCLFIIISGISCSFSRSNLKRGGILAAVALAYTGASYLAENVLGMRGFHVDFGVLHFYASCILFYALIEIVCRHNTVAKAVVALAVMMVVVCLYYLYTPPADTPIWLAPVFPYTDAHGNPATFYNRADFSPGDICNLIPYAACFFAGTALGPVLYPRRYSLLPFLDGKWTLPLGFLGRYAIFVYILHAVVLTVVLALVSVLFVTPGSWGII